MSNMFDFADIESAESTSKYMAPGYHKIRITNLELGDNKSGSKHMKVTFTNSREQTANEKFHITKGAMPRIQYFAENFLGNKLNQAFANEQELVDFFKKNLSTKKEFNVIVGGQISKEDKIYAGLPYTGYVVTDPGFKEGEFLQDSNEWKKYVTTQNSVGTTSSAAVIHEDLLS